MVRIKQQINICVMKIYVNTKISRNVNKQNKSTKALKSKHRNETKMNQNKKRKQAVLLEI